MPMVRFQLRNEFGLGRPALYGVADVEEEPKAVLDGVSVAGFVGILRQLGDLAEFAAVVFHGLQEQVMTTSSRSQKLINRARRLEAALTPLEKAVLSQTSHLHFAYTAGCDWHPLIHNKQNQFIDSDLPPFIMDSYEECQDPPRFHLLDKFDTGGSGSCLKRYSDPTFFKRTSGTPVEANDEKIQRYKKKHKSRGKRKSFLKRDGAVSLPASNSSQTTGTHPISYTNDGHATSQTTSTFDMDFMSKTLESFDMKEESDVRKHSDLRGQSDMLETPRMPTSGMNEQSDMQDQSIEYTNGSGYIEYLLDQSLATKTKERPSAEFCSRSVQEADTVGLFPSEPWVNGDCVVPSRSYEAWEVKVIETKEHKYLLGDDSDTLKNSFGTDTPDKGISHPRSANLEKIQFDEEDILEILSRTNQISCSDRALKSNNESELTGELGLIGKSEIQSGLRSESGIGSEADDFVDAPNTIESDSENEFENQTDQLVYFKEVNDHETEIVYGCNFNVDETEVVFACNGTNEISQNVKYEHPTLRSDQDDIIFEPHEIFCRPGNEENYFVLLDTVPKETILDEPSHRKSMESQEFGFCVNNDHLYSSNKETFATSPSLVEAIPGEKIILGESTAFCPPSVEILHVEDPLLEEAVVTSPSMVNPCENIILQESLAICPPLVKGISGGRIIKDKAISASIAEAEEFHPGEFVALTPSMTEDLSEEVFPGEELFHEDSGDISPPSTEDIPGEKIPQAEFIITSPSLVKAVTSEKCLQDEAYGTSLLVEAVPSEKILRRESAATSPATAEAVHDEEILQEKSVVISSSLVETVPYEKILVEEPTAVSTSVVGAIPGGNIVLEESSTICPLLVESLPDEKVFREESVAACCPGYDHSINKSHICEDKTVSSSLPEPISAENNPYQMTPQVSAEFSRVGLQANGDDCQNNSKGESVASFPSVPIARNEVPGSPIRSSNSTVSSVREPQESSSKSSSVAIWTNGSLLGLAPSKPPVFASPTSSNQDCFSKSEVEAVGNAGSFQIPCSSKGIVSASPYAVTEKPGGYSQQRDKSSPANESTWQTQEIPYGVFGLRHRFLMNGFYRTEVTTKENCHLYDTEAIDESLFGSPSSSPPIEHMKISFNPSKRLEGSGLKLNIPRDNSETFALFQLVPNVASLDDIDAESACDTFCRSSPYISDDCFSDRSELDSEQWDSGESAERKDDELNESVEAASLSASILDLPCFDALNISSPVKKQEIWESKILEKQRDASDSSETDCNEEIVLSYGLTEPQGPVPDANKFNDEEAATCIPPESKNLNSLQNPSQCH